MLILGAFLFNILFQAIELAMYDLMYDVAWSLVFWMDVKRYYSLDSFLEFLCETWKKHLKKRGWK